MLQQLSDKKEQLDQFQPLPRELMTNLREWFRVELTYTSNAIEGSTLTRMETALVVDKGLSVGGRTIREIDEALGHAAAFDYIETLADRDRTDVTERVILDIHEHILRRADAANAGRYRAVPVRIAGSTAITPNYVKVPRLMTDLVEWLHAPSTGADHPVTIAADAHFRFVSIHPFTDGNGRTARLLMNLLLMQAGYPAAIIGPEDRATYLTSLEQAQTGGSLDDYHRCVYTAVDQSLDIYLESVDPPE